MAHSRNIVYTYYPFPSSRKIVTLVSVRDVKISSSATLKVIHKPRVYPKACSIHNNVVFYQSNCIFYDTYLGRKIGHTREWNGISLKH